MLGRSGTRLSQRVIFTALPLLVSASFGTVSGRSSSESSAFKNSAGNTEGEQYQRVPLLKYSSSDEYNPFDTQDILRGDSDRKRHFPVESLSSEADEISFTKPKLFNTNSIPFLVKRKAENQFPHHGKNHNPSNDCSFGKNCPQEIGSDDSSLHYTLFNGDNSKPDPLMNFRHKLGTTLDYEQISLGEHKTRASTVPFTVTASKNAPKGNKISSYPPGTRTTTPSAEPKWVKLEPLNPPRSYDPFTLAKNGSSEESNSTLFASRIGMEMNPESFAERHGWKDGKYSGAGGSKLPAWLEELNYQHGGYGTNNRRQGVEPARPNYDRDREDNNRWVKLDAVPVAGVKISKWVPKNTAPSELPSTSWKHTNKPSWWDRMDTYDNSFGNLPQKQPNHNRPQRYPQHPPSSTWPTRYPQHQPHRHHPSDAWSDVIYPSNNPISATASWASDSKAVSSQSVGVGWQKNPPTGARYPVAAWTSPEKSRPASSGQSPYRFTRPQPTYGQGKPQYYPDPDDKDDQQWVLISSSKNTQQAPPSGPPYSGYEEFPYPFNKNRHSKRITLTRPDKLEAPAVIPTRPMMTQDELFRRTNETLHSLRPVLGGHRDSTTENPPLSQTLIDMLTSTAANIVESTTMKYSNMGMGRSSTPSRIGTGTPARKKRLMDEIHPAAIAGASMIPNTFGSILPLVFNGRKRREVGAIASGKVHTYSNPTLRQS